MRLGDILSKPPKNEYTQIDSFLLNKKGYTGQQVMINIGNIALNYFCSNCNDYRTFFSKGKINCIFLNKYIISINCVLKCICGNYVQLSFIIQSKNDITSQTPKVRILKKNEYLPQNVKKNKTENNDYIQLLEKADHAYQEGLGAGSIIYLRKIYEIITIQIAEKNNIKFEKYDEGNPKRFPSLLEEADKKEQFIPLEFSENGYTLFRKLSAYIHGNFDEKLALQKYKTFRRLIVGIIDNIKNKNELTEVVESLGWKNKE